MKINKLILLFVVICGCFSAKAQNIQLVFRYDDFRLVNDSTNEKVIRLLQKYDIPVTLGVIPCDANEQFKMDKDYRFLNELKGLVNNGSVEIALHGLTHRRMTPYGEFKGLCIEEQTRRIKKGKSFLDSIFSNCLTTYIPPWNSHDENTVKALKSNNIYIVSSSVYDVWAETVYYPMTTDNFEGLGALIKGNQSLGGIIVVMLHPTNFKTAKSFSNLEQVLIQIKNDKNIRYYTFRGLEDAGIYVNNIQTEDQTRHNLLSKMLRMKGVFISSRAIIIIRILNIVLYLLVLFIVYYLLQLIVLRDHRHHNIIQYFVLFWIGVFIAISTWYYWWGPMKLGAVFLLIMLLLPFVFRFFKVYDIALKIHLKKK
jgi:Predicted deacetylase